MLMKYGLSILMLCGILLISCESPEKNMEKWKKEIADIEKEFNDMAQAEGLSKAFEYFAANDGVIRRRKTIIQGKNDIRKWYDNDVQPNETLTWKPTFIDVSSSGDLAYTYGDFTFTYPDTLGNLKENKGIFHTVWKRQANGEWRFVWD